MPSVSAVVLTAAPKSVNCIDTRIVVRSIAGHRSNLPRDGSVPAATKVGLPVPIVPKKEFCFASPRPRDCSWQERSNKCTATADSFPMATVARAEW